DCDGCADRARAARRGGRRRVPSLPLALRPLAEAGPLREAAHRLGHAGVRAVEPEARPAIAVGRDLHLLAALDELEVVLEPLARRNLGDAALEHLDRLRLLVARGEAPGVDGTREI